MDYTIDSTFRNINRLFVLTLKNSNNDPAINSSDSYFMSLLEIKDFNESIDNKSFFDKPVKNKQEEYEKLVETSKNDYYTTGNLLVFPYHQNLLV